MISNLQTVQAQTLGHYCSKIKSYKASHEAEEYPPKGSFSRVFLAEADTDCGFGVLYEYRDATTALATVFIALFTLILWRSTHLLWKEARESRQLTILTVNASGVAANAASRSAKTAEAALLVGQRAYVLFDLFEVSQPTDLGDLSVVLIPTWKNAGLTPAKNAIAHVNTTVLDTDLPDDFQFPDLGNTDAIPFTIAANAPFHAATLTIPGEMVTRVMRNESRAFIWGWVDYNDIFTGTDRHRTEMCYEMARMVRGRNAAPGQRQQSAIRFILYRKHNNTDDGCTKKPQPFPI